MKVAIIGSRKVFDYNLIASTLLRHVDTLDGITIVSGGARGVDHIAATIARRHNLPLIEHLPDYKRYGRIAPLIRNTKIVEDADIILAFPSVDAFGHLSHGTMDAVRKAYARKKPIYVYRCKV